MIKNKVIITFSLEDGCSQKEDEARVHWRPINFDIYNDLFVDLIKEAADEWLSENVIANNVEYEVIFAHNVETDGGGAITSEYFEPIHQERQRY